MDAMTYLLVGASSALTAIGIAMFVGRFAPIWDRLADRQMGRLSRRFQQLSLSEERLQLFLRVWGVVLVSGTVTLCWALDKPPLALVFGFLAYMAPRHMLDALIRRRSRLLRDQLVAASVGIGNGVRAGLSLAQAIESVGNATPKPLADELRRICFQFERGRPLLEAIEDVRGRLDLEPFTLFAVALEVAHKRGGRLSETLQRISASLQENRRLERRIESETSTGRQTVVILSVFPLIFLLTFALLDPHSTGLLWSRLDGQCLLAVVAILVYAGASWANHIMKMEV
jgi:tight adherence protein B